MDFYERNRQVWIDIQNKIFPNGIPKHCEWTELEGIISVLNTIGSVKGSNHLFYPTGGGLDIKSSELSSEKNCIEIFCGPGHTEVLKPKRFLFESFADPIWNYFRIETSELKPSGVYKKKDIPIEIEEIAEIETGKYISKSEHELGEYQGQKLPRSARLLTRHIEGAFVIFAKSSYYNKNTTTYDARHDKMTAEKFRTYIEQVMENGW